MNEISIELDPEDSRVTVFGLAEDGTAFGIENLLSSSNSIRPIPTYFRDRRSEPAAALTGC